MQRQALAFVNGKDSVAADSVKKKSFKLYEAGVKAGYSYGFIQGYTFDQSFPNQMFLAEGNAGIKAFNIPFLAEFRYATLRIPYGLNNYFRIKFDKDQYLREIEAKRQVLKKVRKINTDSLFRQRQVLLQKLYYQQNRFQEMMRQKSDSLRQLIPDSVFNKIPTNLNTLHAELPDSLKFHLPDIPGVQGRSLTDSLQQLSQTYNEMLGKIKRIDHLIDSVKNIDRLRLPGNLEDVTDRYKSEISKQKERRAFKLNALEMGTCYPNNSYLMYGTLPVNGVFTDLEYQGIYFSFLYGEVVNNFLFANTFFERQLLSTRNVTNFFDFNRTNRGRKITAFKIGKGRFQDNHIHAGFLYGIGLKNYGDTNLVSDITLQPRQTNAVIEISSRYKWGKHQFEFATAKSVLADHRSGELMKGFSQFDHTYNLAGMLVYSTSFFKDRTRLRILVRHIQPYFQSFGLGFVNGDYLRLNLKVDQKISKKINIGAFVKNDVDNLYNLVTMTNNIMNYGVNSGIRIGRFINVKLTYNPIVQRVIDHHSGNTTRLNNYLYNANLSWNKRAGKTNLQTNLNYNYFKLNDFNGRLNQFQNITFNQSVSAGKTTLALTTTYFSSNIIDSLNRNNFMNTLTATFNIKRVSLKIGAKQFSNLKGMNDYGALAGVVVPMSKLFSLSIDAQKFVVGDYFLSNNMSLSGKTPYYFNISLLLRL